jgi:hypothetical protein
MQIKEEKANLTYFAQPMSNRGGSRNNIIRRLLAVCKNNKIKKEKFRLEFKNVL